MILILECLNFHYKSGTPAVAKYLLFESRPHLASIGSFLRKFSLDGLLELRSILVDDMGFVGPRPALFNQDFNRFESPMYCG